MSIKREKILYDGGDLNLNIKLSSNTNLSGLQQEIDNFSVIKSVDLVNDVTDGEVKTFELTGGTNRKISFGFASSNNVWYPRFTYAGFSTSEIEEYDKKYLSSFFILDFFDTYKTTEQTKIFSTYLTKLNVFNYDGNPINSEYVFDNRSETHFRRTFKYNYLNIPNSFFNSDQQIYYGYLRFSFYNAKTGKVSIFYNKDNVNLNTSEKMFFKVMIDLNSKKWNIITPSFQDDEIKTIFARELTNSQEYIDKYNNTFNNVDNLKQNYPSGNTFNYSGATYSSNS